MFRHGAISTETDRKPFFFTLTAAVVGLSGTVLLFVLAYGNALAVFAGVLLGIVTIAAFCVLLALVTDRAYVENDTLYMRYLLKKRSIPIDGIGKITCRDDVYTVYGKNGAIAGTINAKLTGIGEVIHELDKRGVNFL